MLGDPNLAMSETILKVLIESGADALEVGLPFSDPVADGPVIQRAAMRAIAAGATTKSCFELLSRVREKFADIPIGILTYANLVVHKGAETFYKDAKLSGVDSILIADVPTLECAPFAAKAVEFGIDPVLIVPPNASDAQLQKIAKMGRGYTYVVTRSGVTGADSRVQFDAQDLLYKLGENGAPPAVFGFGISSPEHVRGALRAGASGAISGSAIVTLIEKNMGNEGKLREALRDFVIQMKSATR